MREEMLAEILEIRDSGLAAAAQADSDEALEQVRIQYLGRKGRFSTLTPKLPLLPPEERPRVGELINESKRAIEEAVAARSAQLERERLERLGDTEAMVRKHYAAWVPERQARLTRILKDAFDDKPKPSLVAIPGGRD